MLVCALLAAGCSGGGGGVDGPLWPPELPRQPGRLALAAPDVADPLDWWRLNLLNPLPEGIYDREEAARLAADLVARTNAARLENGAGAVVEFEELDRVSQAHSVDQATRDYWAHATPEGLGSRQRILAATGRVVSVGGENSSIALTDGETAEGIVRGWLTHAGHRDLLLNPDVKYIGIGVYRFAPGEPWFYTQLLVDFDTPAE